MSKLYTFLGHTNYNQAYYQLNDETSRQTPYIQEALLDIMNSHDTVIDEVVIFLTEEAREKHWESAEKSETEDRTHSENNFAADKEIMLLKKRLEAFGIKLNPISIVPATTKDEVWALYEEIIGTIQEGDDILFDITHSFRYQPMIAMLVMHFAKAIKNASIKGVFYGNYDMAQKKNSEFVHPILDLSMISDMQNWISHAHVFAETGRADVLTKWLSEEQEKIRNVEKGQATDIESIEKVTRRWLELDQIIRTNLSLKRPKAAQELVNAIEQMEKTEVRQLFKPISEIMKKYKAEFEVLADKNQLKGDLNTVRWNLKLGNIQPALTILAEITLSSIVQKAGLELEKRTNRDAAGAILHHATEESIGHEKKPDAETAWKSVAEDIEKELKDSFWDLDLCEEAFKDLFSRPDLLKVVKNLSENRNIVNHAGFRDSEIPVARKLIDKTEKYFEQYQTFIVKYHEGVPE